MTEIDDRATIKEAVEEVWPAPSFRKHQKETIINITEALFVDDYDGVALSAPTGAGKSLILYTVSRVLSKLRDEKTFSTTPLNTLIDQIESDDLLSDAVTLKGKNNYSCVHPMDHGANVDDAICQRMDGFHCEYKERFPEDGGCPYYGKKELGQISDTLVTNLSYLMTNAMIPTEYGFEPRTLLQIDECIPKGEVVTNTDGRQVEIERFKCEEPLSVNTDTHMVEEDSLVEVKQTKTKYCVFVEASRGSFTASHDHKVKDINGWVKASNVERIARPIINTKQKSQKEARASILGYWFGDGWISSSVGVSGDIVDLKKLDSDVERVYGFSSTRTRGETGGGSVKPTNGSRHSINGKSNTYGYQTKLANALQEDGLPRGDKTIQDCHIPYFDTDDEKKSFIAGFFGAEGNSPTVVGEDGKCFNVIKASRYTTGNCPFMQEMKEMLEGFGISCYIDVANGNKRKDGTETTRYDLVIESGKENILRFTKEIGFDYCKRKQVESEIVRTYLSEYLSKLKEWRHDYNRIISACEEREWEYGSVKDEVSSRGYADKMKRYVSKRDKPKQVTGFPTFNEWRGEFVKDDIVYEQVQNIEEVGKRKCYDLEVKNNHNFLVGDGYLAHNCQNIEDFALQFIGFTIDSSRIPVDFNELPRVPRESASMERMVEWLNRLLSLLIEKTNHLNSKPNLSNAENTDLKRLERVKHRVINFLEDQKKGKHWTKTHDSDSGAVAFEPVFIGRFIDRFLWSQADKYILSSATIPKGNFLEEIGLGDKDIKRIDVPSTFPKERRPVVTDYVGKMTKSERRETMPKMADKIAEIANHHKGENGFVHCNSYNIMESLYELLPKSIQRRTMKQDSDDREESLEQWMRSDKQIFLSVAMDEGISLDEDKARWQVVAKASYPFVGDERVSYRLNELNDWDWYNGCAVINLQQAVGRGMRSKDDYCVSYLLDSSFKSLLNKNRNLFEGWFLESVNCDTELDVLEQETKFNLSA